jgi:glycosyltransferase involved in cell wall biosynthesis
MRVLHVDTGKEMRGGQWQLLRLMEGMAEGHEPVLLAPRGSPLIQEAARRGLAHEPLRLVKLVRLSKSADLVHAHDAGAHSLAAVLMRRPLVVARRVAFPIQRNPASRWKYARADHYIAVSRHVQNVLISGGISADKISVVYDGVPLATPVPGDELPERELPERELIVAPATADPAKGTELVRQAASMARVSVNFSENLEKDLRRAAVFLYITRSEGLGSAILLAMAAGVPVLASRVGGIPELVEDGRTGLLTENTAESIAAGLHRLLEDAALRRALAARALDAVAERYSVPAMVRGTLGVYQQVLSC